MEENSILPFLKWAGGKRWLASRHSNLFPNKFGSYFEPFLGSGAVFFELQPQRAFLSDINPNLINVYIAIRDSWPRVQATLKEHQKYHSRNYYYDIRDQIHSDLPTKAAQFLYLNRACWNGLYRVNKLGKFNVPKGTKTSIILDTDNFEAIAKILKSTKIETCDFEIALNRSDKDDFVFVDPPYTTKHNFNGFVKYNDKLFSWADQERLLDAVNRAKSRGVKVLITNADHAEVRHLYKGVGSFKSLKRASVLAGNSKYRSHVTEIVIRTW